MRDFQTPGRSLVFAANGMCATSHPLAAQVAVAMLQRGGNAVDAAIAAAVLLGIAEPQSTGIGGDCFVLVKPADEQRIIGLNGSGRAPGGLDAAALRDAGHTVMPTHDTAAVTIPGAIDAFVRLSQDWGRLGLEDSLAPAIAYADAGVPVAPRVAFDWLEASALLKGDARRFFLLDSQAPNPGQIFRAEGQAEVLRRVAAEGRAGYYEGEVAEDLVTSLRALGGTHTLEDFALTACDYVEPIRGSYRGHDLIEMPPNGQGAVAILMAKILGQFELGDLAPFGADRAHLEAEAAKLAYDARDRFIADPDATPLRLDHMLGDETATRLAALIDPRRASDARASRTESLPRDTVYLTVVDRDRMAVSLIYSIYQSFGAGLASAKFGVNFQNRGAGFNLTQGHPNEAGPGKRPMHTIIPAMLMREGNVLMPFGVMGGAYQPAGHMRLLGNLIDYGMDMQSAIDAPRSFPADGALQLETGYAADVADALTALGHRIDRCRAPLGGAQAIAIDAGNGVLIGASDPRKDGCALGY